MVRVSDLSSVWQAGGIAVIASTGALAAATPTSPTVEMFDFDVRPVLTAWFVVAFLFASAMLWARVRASSTEADGSMAILRILAVPLTAILLEAARTELTSQRTLAFTHAVALAAGIALFLSLWLAAVPSWRSVWAYRGALVRRLALNPLNLLVVAAVILFRALPSADAAPSSTEPRLVGEHFEKWFVTQPRMTDVLPQSTADVTIVEFIDYQCPVCKEANRYYEAQILAEARTRYPNRIKHLRVDLPLDNECNPRTKTAHAWACEAAVAMRLADEKGKAKEFEAWLWENQRRLSPSDIYRGVREIAGVSDMSERYAEMIAKVKEDIELAAKLGVASTPTYFINGVNLGFMPAQNWKRALRIELETPSVK
jgi:protein-disulfide isomerase